MNELALAKSPSEGHGWASYSKWTVFVSKNSFWIVFIPLTVS